MIAKIQEHIKEAMKARNKPRLEVLRMLLADLMKEQIDSGKKIDEASFVQIVKRGIKKRKESIGHFKTGNRQDLVDKETAQIKVLEEFAPKQLSEEEVEKIVQETISETGASGKQDIGKVMKAVMGKYGDQVDGKTIQQIVGTKLS